MNVGLYRGAVAMVAQGRRLETISSNLANLGTVGYKRSTTASHEFQATRQNRRVRGLSVRSQVDFSQGNLSRTGRAYDLALFGDGFFAIEGENGELYTRDGSFHPTPDGLLVTEEGHPVVWEHRQAVIDPSGLPIVVDGEGNVRQGLVEIGRLRVVDFKDKAALGRTQQGFWQAPPRLPEATATATVHQYTLEESNANGMEEIVAMIGVQRSFESIANVLSSIEEGYRRLTRPF